MSSEKLLKYYQQEINFLIENGKYFADQYPDIAKYMNFSSFSTTDPDIQRLIESVAFLNAKLQKRLDEQEPKIVNEILSNTYPQFNNPIPSLCMMQFETPQNMIEIEKGAKVITKETINDQKYRFRTTMKTKLTKCQIINAEIKKSIYCALPKNLIDITENVLCININSIDKVDELVFYINLQELEANMLYEAIFSFSSDVGAVALENNKIIATIEEVGFDEHTELFPTQVNEDTSYKMLTEYLNFPQKFLFFKLNFSSSPENEILIPLNLKKNLYIKKENILLNCVPAINIFEKNSEPIVIDNKTCDYAINADNNKSKQIEIYSILSVQDTNNTLQYKNFFAPHYDADEKTCFWISNKTFNYNLQEYATNIALMNHQFQDMILYAKLLCLQKDCKDAIDDQINWVLEDYNNIKCINLNKPTGYLEQEDDVEAKWKLISHISMNYVGLNNTQDFMKMLEEIITIYDIGHTFNKNIIYSITNISNETSMISENGKILPKMNINVETENPNIKLFIFLHVVGTFLAKHIDFNQKCDLTIYKDKKKYKQWKIV